MRSEALSNAVRRAVIMGFHKKPKKEKKEERKKKMDPAASPWGQISAKHSRFAMEKLHRCENSV